MKRVRRAASLRGVNRVMDHAQLTGREQVTRQRPRPYFSRTATGDRRTLAAHLSRSPSADIDAEWHARRGTVCNFQ